MALEVNSWHTLYTGKANGHNEMKVKIIFKMDINCKNSFCSFVLLLKAFLTIMPDINHIQKSEMHSEQRTK